jgi:hypothetical protein
MPKIVRLLASVALATSLAACGGIDSPSTQTTEDFNGTLDPLGTASKTFSIAKTGEMQVTLQSLAPRPVVGFIALAVGTPAGTSCSPIGSYVVSQAAVGTPYSFPQVVKGSYCVIVADAAGVLTTQATFSVKVSHP